ncbi:aspartyl-phosphate phosphatase Spo0E family protein [Salipaludibacillus sp. CF4.18]
MRMIFNGRSKGLTHPATIKDSQKLDVLLNRYYRITILIKST